LDRIESTIPPRRTLIRANPRQLAISQLVQPRDQPQADGNRLRFAVRARTPMIDGKQKIARLKLHSLLPHAIAELNFASKRIFD
jgi:lipopolysaccharide export system protein LptA